MCSSSIPSSIASRAPSYKGSETTSSGDHQPTPASEAGCDAAGSSWKRLASGHDEDVTPTRLKTAGHRWGPSNFLSRVFVISWVIKAKFLE